MTEPVPGVEAPFIPLLVSPVADSVSTVQPVPSLVTDIPSKQSTSPISDDEFSPAPEPDMLSVLPADTNVLPLKQEQTVTDSGQEQVTQPTQSPSSLQESPPAQPSSELNPQTLQPSSELNPHSQTQSRTLEEQLLELDPDFFSPQDEAQTNESEKALSDLLDALASFRPPPKAEASDVIDALSALETITMDTSSHQSTPAKETQCLPNKTIVDGKNQEVSQPPKTEEHTQGQQILPANNSERNEEIKLTGSRIKNICDLIAGIDVSAIPDTKQTNSVEVNQEIKASVVTQEIALANNASTPTVQPEQPKLLVEQPPEQPTNNASTPTVQPELPSEQQPEKPSERQTEQTSGTVQQNAEPTAQQIQHIATSLDSHPKNDVQEEKPVSPLASSETSKSKVELALHEQQAPELSKEKIEITQPTPQKTEPAVTLQSVSDSSTPISCSSTCVVTELAQKATTSEQTEVDDLIELDGQTTQMSSDKPVTAVSEASSLGKSRSDSFELPNIDISTLDAPTSKIFADSESTFVATIFDSRLLPRSIRRLSCAYLHYSVFNIYSANCLC